MNRADVQKPRRFRWLFWLSMAGLLALAVTFPVCDGRAERSASVVNLLNAKSIFPALKLYAGDHDGRYPMSLRELVPAYPSQEHFEKAQFRDIDSDRRYEWAYVPGLIETDPANWIILASPTDQALEDAERKTRVIVRNDGSAFLASEAKLRQELAEQLAAMKTRHAAP